MADTQVHSMADSPADPTIAEETASWPTFALGQRVRLLGDLVALALVKRTGTIVGPDPQWDGYYLVRLDAPAWDRETHAEHWEIREAADNMEPLGRWGD